MRTEIRINNQFIELNEDLAMAFTYNIADIREPENRQSDFSKTVTLPATSLNNKIFSNIFQIDKIINQLNYTANFAPDFNPNKKAPAIVYVDSIQVFKGFLQLTKINLVNKRADSYDVVFYGSLSNIFKEIGEDYLTQLDFSEYDHDWTKTNITESWATRIQKNGANYVNFSGGNPTGEGYVYPLIDYGRNNGLNYKVTDLFPAIYTKTYIDTLFSTYGYTYTSDFFNSTFFKRLIIPFNKKALALSQADIDSRTFRVSSGLCENYNYDGLNFITEYDGATRPIPLTNTTSVIFWDEVTAPNKDLNNLYVSDIYDPAVGRYTNNHTGDYNLIINILFAFHIDIIQPSDSIKIVAASGNLTVEFFVYRYNVLSNTTDLLTSYTQVFDTATLDFSTPTNYFNDQMGGFVFNDTLSSVPLKVGDYVYIQRTITTEATFIDSAANIKFYNYSIDLGLEDAYFYNEPVGFALQETDLIPANELVPNKVKSKDFLKSIIKMFNLYIDIDKTNESNLIIEPREDYYNTEYVEWTDKVDMDSDFNVIPMGDLDAKKYHFTYTKDVDHYNTKYQDLFDGNIYGNITLQVNNDFIQNENTNQVIFSPTPAIGSTLHNRVIPSIIKYDATQLNSAMPDLTTKEPIDVNIRILYYAGLKSSNVSFNITSISSGATSYSSYPFANHIDDRDAPTIDLCFGSPQYLYYTATTYTNNNLFNKYWSRLMGQITDPNSKIVKCKVLLNPKDILVLDFKKLYLIDGNYFRLNKILDYDPLAGNLTEVELLKIRNITPFTGSATVVIPLVTSYNYLQGGLDEVRDAGATSYYNLVQGGLDEVRDIGATSPINLVNGGLNSI